MDVLYSACLLCLFLLRAFRAISTPNSILSVNLLTIPRLAPALSCCCVTRSLTFHSYTYILQSLPDHLFCARWLRPVPVIPPLLVETLFSLCELWAGSADRRDGQRKLEGGPGRPEARDPAIPTSLAVTVYGAASRRPRSSEANCSLIGPTSSKSGPYPITLANLLQKPDPLYGEPMSRARERTAPNPLSHLRPPALEPAALSHRPLTGNASPARGRPGVMNDGADRETM